MRLYEGLTNRRTRGIRSDWKASFCKLMHWPKNSAIQRIDSKDAVLILRDGCSLKAKDFHSDELQELLRGALTLCVSALDRYMHERIVKKIIAALKKPPVRDGKRTHLREQREFSIPALVALQVAQRVVASKKTKVAKRIRPANEVRNAIQDALHKRTFQSWRELEDGFRLIGISGLSGALQPLYGTPIQPVQNHLNKIAQKRNRIVHEADLVRHRRGGKTRLHPITAVEVRTTITFLDDLVAKLETVTG